MPLLKSIKGIGEKSAQLIIIDLKGKLGKEDSGVNFNFTSHNKSREEALSALVMLGFAKNLAEKALDKVLKTEAPSVSVEQLIKLSLKNI